MGYSREMRENRGMLLEELAQECRIPSATLRKYETGDISPIMDDLEKIASVLDYYISDLFESDLT